MELRKEITEALNVIISIVDNTKLTVSERTYVNNSVNTIIKELQDLSSIKLSSEEPIKNK